MELFGHFLLNLWYTDKLVVLEGVAHAKDDDQHEGDGARHEIIRRLLERRGLNLEEEKQRREHAADHELHHRPLVEHHQTDEDESTEHLDQLPPE